MSSPDPADGPERAQPPAPPEITCSGGLRLPPLNAPRDRDQAEDGGEDRGE